MIAHLAQHPILFATHILAAVLGYLVHYYLVCRQHHRHEEPLLFDVKQVVSVGINIIILTLFIATTIDSQYFDGPTPGLVFTIMASWSFGSIAAERSFFMELVQVLAGRGAGKK